MSDKDQRKVPLLRFKGFTNDWEQRKLGDKIIRIKSYSISHGYETMHDTNTKYIHYGDIHTGKVKVINDINILPNIKDNNYIGLNKGDIVVADASEDYKGIADACLVNTDSNKIVAGLHTIALRPQKDTYPQYLYTYLSTDIFKHFGYKTGTGLKVFGISYKELAKFLVSSPSIKEQKEISKLISLIEKNIDLQQRKLDRLLLLKKAYLTNLLPDKTQNPKVRFKEFNDKWKKLKLGNISSISAGGDVNKQKLLKKGRYPVIANALTNKGVIGYYESKYRIQAPAVTVTGRGDIGHAYARKTNFTPVVRLLSIKSKHNVDFLAEAINQKKVPFESTGVPQLTVPKLSNYKILFPSSITEENKIGNFIIKFDEIINLQNKKISSLEQVKNFLLQNMFI